MSEDTDVARRKAKEAEASAQHEREHGASTSSDSFQVYESDEDTITPTCCKTNYPKSVFFIIGNEFCERFSYYGMRTILSLYFIYQLHYSELEAKLLYHTFTMFVYFFPIFGAIISDSWLGKYHTIFYVSIIYACGNVVLSIAAIEPLGLPMRAVSIIGLLLIAIGTGGIKPCVSAFGGDQFTLPQQAAQLASFFSLFYFAINCGSLISTVLTPILREEVTCFGQDTCFPLAFGIPGILMVTSLIIFVIGKPLYKIKKPEGNIIVTVSKCIGHAISNRRKSDRNQEKKDHWLDYANDTYDQQLIEDIKSTLRVLWLYIPIPFFWALFDQQGTGWTFMATRMNGDIGITTILPDQMQVANPLLILAFIPLFDYIIYPVIAKCNLLKKPLHRMEVGGFLAALSFVISALIQLQIETEYPVLPEAGQGQLRLYNGLPCNVKLENAQFNIEMPSMTIFEKKDYAIAGNESFSYKVTLDSSCPGIVDQGTYTYDFYMSEKEILGHLITLDSDNKIIVHSYDDNVEKDSHGYPLIRTLVSTRNAEVFNLTYYSSIDEAKLNTNTSDMTFKSNLPPDKYYIKINDKKITDPVEIKLGGVYTALVSFVDPDSPSLKLFTITPPNGLHILWLLPQYIVITMAEIMFSITGLEFSYSQAPTSMKSVMQAGWLLTTAVGNLLVVIIEKFGELDSQAMMFFLWAGLMAADMIVFTIMAAKYKYVDKEITEEDIQEAEAKEKA